jgi:CopG family nickel-responsive transcriptional regulator
MGEIVVKINISLNKKLLREFEEVLKDRGYQSRSKAIRDALKDYITRHKWITEMEEERIGVISVIYNPHLTSTLKNLTDIEYDFRRYINSVLHVYLKLKISA